MNNLENEKIKAFVMDIVMYEAVKKILLEETQIDYIDIAGEHLDNENLGAKTRALAEGKKMIEKGFKKLQEFIIKDNKLNSKKNIAL